MLIIYYYVLIVLSFKLIDVVNTLMSPLRARLESWAENPEISGATSHHLVRISVHISNTLCTLGVHFYAECNLVRIF